MVHIITRNYLICFMGKESRENDTETLIFLKNGRNKEKKILPGFEPGTSGTKE